MESGKYAELCAYQDNISGQTWIPIHDCPLSESTCKLLNRVVPNGTLRGVEGEGQISPIRLADLSTRKYLKGYKDVSIAEIKLENYRELQCDKL